MDCRTTRRIRSLAAGLAAVLAVPVVASAAPQLAPSAITQLNALRSLKSTKTAVENKIDSRLYLGLLHQRNDARLAPLTDFRFVRPEADGLVPVNIPVASAAGVKAVVNAITARGGVVRSSSYAYRVVTARVHLDDLESLAAMPQVRKVRQAMPAMTHVVNVSEGDQTHGADEARSFFGTDGTGVKVCVLSDAVDSLASLQASGDLPAVDVLPGQAGSGGDEGSAMLEIIHDLAPGATLGFATAFTDEASFAQNILDLATDGCNIIVDDVIYFDESPFEDGPVAQAVNTVTGAGVLYFSSAGNEGNNDDLTSGTWEGDFLASGAADPGPLAGANLHNFGDGGNSILVEVGGTPLLIWAEHYDLATGLASTDFDIYDMDGALATIFDASTDVQDGTGGDDFPIEFIGGGSFSGERMLIDQFAAGSTTSVPMFNFINFRGELDDNLATGGATRGHSAAVDSFSVAATPAAASFDGITPDGPFPGLFTAANESESFTSDGLRRVILTTAGAEITPGNRTSTGGTVRQKPDITAADGVACAAPGFNPFYGTSAAAPHAAAIAALMKSSVPAATPAQIRTALITSAIDIEAVGTDVDTGAGIVMAHAAILAIGGVPQAFLAAGTAVSTEAVGDADAYIEPNETWSLTIPLTNNGGVAASAISAVLSSSTPGVTVGGANSAYPNLAIAASANNTTPYSFSVGGAVPCGGAIDFTLTVTYTGGPSPQSFNFSLGTGSPGTPVAFAYAGPVVAIADSAGANVPGPTAIAQLPIASPGNLVGLTASIDGTVCSATAGSTTVGLDHTFVNDLQIDLMSPTGTLVTVINRTDGGGNNLCQTVLDDTSATNIQTALSAQAPFTGTWQPANPLSGFGGEAITGTWELHVTDFFVGDTGNIRNFSVTITPAVCDAPVPPQANLSITKTGVAAPGSITYTLTVSNAGPDTATNVVVTDTFPPELSYVSNTCGGTGTSPWTWNVGSLANGANAVCNITLSVVTPGPVSNTASVTATELDTTPANNASTATNTVAGGQNVVEVPTLGDFGLGALGALVAAAGLARMRRRRALQQ
jgi:uncharacterized repeat protein (TIGR01451 family)